MFVSLSSNVKVNTAFIVRATILYAIEKTLHQEDNLQYYEYKFEYKELVFRSKGKRILLLELHNGSVDVIRNESKITEVMSKL